jgi:glucokinase
MSGGVGSGRLVADVGGSNVRFAIADADGRLAQATSYLIADFASFADALQSYLTATGHPKFGAGAIAAAGPIDGGRVDITNNNWSIDRAEVSVALGGVPVAIVNDLEAMAAALPYLGPDDYAAIGAPAPRQGDHRTMLAFNVGTGLGAASALFRAGRWWTAPSEAGHMTLGPLIRDGIEIAAEGASIESVLSGAGVVALHRRILQDQGISQHSLRDASEVFARIGRDAAAARTVALLTVVLGRIAGDLVLATASWGGVYFCGSVATAWAALADPAQFRDEFVRKGPMQPRMLHVPSAVIRREHAALFGLAMLPLAE